MERMDKSEGSTYVRGIEDGEVVRKKCSGSSSSSSSVGSITESSAPQKPMKRRSACDMAEWRGVQ